MENQTVEELAALLGKTLKESDQYKALEAAQAEYAKATFLTTSMTEYNAQMSAYESESSKENPDALILAAIERRTEELREIITSDPVFKALDEAQQSFSALMADVNGILEYNLTGHAPCTHDCSTCHSHCHDSEG